MNDALRVHNHVNLFRRTVKQPSRLNHLKAFVDHCGTVNCDFITHLPVRMSERLFFRYSLQLVWGHSSERPSGRGQNNFIQYSRTLPLQTLKNSTVLAVYRKNPNFLLFGQPHDIFTGADQSFFIGQRDILSRQYGLNSRPQADHPHHRRNNGIRFSHGHDFQQAFHPVQQTGLLFFPVSSQLSVRCLIIYHSRKRMETAYLILQLLYGCIDRQSGDSEFIRKALRNIQCLRPDRPSRTQNNNIFHPILHHYMPNCMAI